MSRAKAVKLFESTAVGMVRILHAVVPLAEGACGVACGFEAVSDGHLVEIHPLATGGGAEDTAAGVVAAGQKLGASGRADGTDKEAIKAGAIAAQAVDVWRVEVLVAVQAEVAPTLVIGENDNDIGRSGSGDQRQKKDEKLKHESIQRGCGVSTKTRMRV